MLIRKAASAILIVAAAGVLASCSSSGPVVRFSSATKEFFSERTYGPASPRVAYAGPVRKGGGRAMLGDPYRVAGKTYIPRDNPRYSATGLASWYGAAFHGRLTANGEIYDVNGLTAAHPTLPLPSYVRVTNLSNGRSLIVRVNDRGPFAENRLIDVSAKAADMLGFRESGTAKVRVDYMGPAQMDGQDGRKLMASYRDPAGGFGGSTFAFNSEPPPVAAPAPAPIQVAAVAPMPKARPPKFPVLPDDAPLVAGAAPLVLMPAYAPTDDEDLLGPLILRSTGFVNSYANAPRPTAAQTAASALAKSGQTQADLSAALARAAAKKALQLRGTSTGGDGATVLLGAFSDPTNADRVAANFRRFGQVASLDQPTGGRSLRVVRVTLDASVDPADVVDAAAAAGLSGAHVITQ